MRIYSDHLHWYVSAVIAFCVSTNLANGQTQSLRNRMDSLERRFDASLEAHDGYAQGREQFERDVYSRFSRLESELAATRTDNAAIRTELSQVNAHIQRLEQSKRRDSAGDFALRTQVQPATNSVVERGYSNADARRHIAELRTKLELQRNGIPRPEDYRPNYPTPPTIHRYATYTDALSEEDDIETCPCGFCRPAAERYFSSSAIVVTHFGSHR